MSPSDSDQQDLALIGRLQSNDGSALDELMERYRAPLHRYIYRFVHNATDAAEILEETFVKLYFKRDQFRPTKSFRAWIYTIAANLCHDWARRNKRRPSVSVGDFFDSSMAEAADESTPANDVANQDDVQQLRDAVDKLPSKLQEAVILYHLEERSHDECATILGCTTKAVETRLYQARKRLKLMLEF